MERRVEQGGTRRRMSGTLLGVLVLQALAFALGAWKGYGFGELIGGPPLGLAHGIKLLRPVPQGESLSWDDVAVDTSTDAYKLRREMERLFAPTVVG